MKKNDFKIGDIVVYNNLVIKEVRNKIGLIVALKNRYGQYHIFCENNIWYSEKNMKKIGE